MITMTGLVIRCNLTCSDRVSHFSPQWSSHWNGQGVGWLTDLHLVGSEGMGWDRVGVHRAVIVPLCPLTALAEQDVTRDDPIIILPQFSVELIKAFVSLVYTGSATITDVVTVTNLLELMESLGLKMPMDRLSVTQDEVSDVQIIGFKNPSGLEIIAVNSATPHLPAPAKSGVRNSLEITRTPNVGNLAVLSKIVQKKRWLSTLRKTRSKEKLRKLDHHVVNDGDERQDGEISEMEEEAANLVEPVLEIKLECEDGVEYLYDVAEVQSTKKRKWTRKNETLLKHTHQCDYCDYKCRFEKDLQEHSDLFHSDKEFSCQKCDFRTSGIALLRFHNKKKHIGVGNYICDICALKVNSKRKLNYHRARVHAFVGFEIGGKRKKYFEFHKTVDIIDESDPKAAEDLNASEVKVVKELIGDATSENLDVQHPDTEVVLNVNQNIDLLEFALESDHVKNTLNEIGENEKEDTRDTFNKEDFFKDDIDHSSEVITSKCISFDANADEESPILENIGNILKDNPLENQINPDGKLENIENLIIDSPTKNQKNQDEKTDDDEAASPKISKEVVGFKCSVPNCSNVSRVFKTRTATSALTKLKDHHAKYHEDVNDGFSYTILYKEDIKDSHAVKELEQLAVDDPLMILKKLKKSHKKASSGSGSASKLSKIVGELRKKGEM